MLLMSVVSVILGAYAIYHCLGLINTDTTYALVLFCTIIPNLIGDGYIIYWMIRDDNYTRDCLISGSGLNLIGVVGQTLWEILDHHSFKHWWDDRIELMLILLRGGLLTLICFYFMTITERYFEMKFKPRSE